MNFKVMGLFLLTFLAFQPVTAMQGPKNSFLNKINFSSVKNWGKPAASWVISVGLSMLADKAVRFIGDKYLFPEDSLYGYSMNKGFQITDAIFKTNIKSMENFEKHIRKNFNLNSINLKNITNLKTGAAFAGGLAGALVVIIPTVLIAGKLDNLLQKQLHLISSHSSQKEMWGRWIARTVSVLVTP